MAAERHQCKAGVAVLQLCHHMHCLCPFPGFTSFVSLNELRDPARGLLVDDKLRIKVTLCCRRRRHCCLPLCNNRNWSSTLLV